MARGAYLRLQDHGAPVWFRNLRMRAIPADEKLVPSNFTPMPIPEAALEKEQEHVRQMLRAKGARQRERDQNGQPRVRLELEVYVLSLSYTEQADSLTLLAVAIRWHGGFGTGHGRPLQAVVQMVVRPGRETQTRFGMAGRPVAD